MRQNEALAEARRRWPNAIVYTEAGKMVVCEKPTHWTKGKLDARIWGEGYSWEAAFADADRRSESKGEER